MAVVVRLLTGWEVFGMMRWIVGSSLKFRGLVVAVAAGLLFLGVRVLPNAPVDTLPEFLPPTVEVQTEALGLSAEEVEQLITVPLEQDLLVGVAFLDEIESVSLPGLSSVVLTFEPGTDLLDARQVVAERLTQAVGVAGLPEVAKPPQMLQPLSSTSRVAMVQMSSNDLSLIEMSVLARWVVSPRLVGVEGVANVSIWGFRDRQLQVLVDPEHLAEQSVTLNQVIRTAGNALEVSPLSFLEASSPGTGGFIDTVNQRLHVFHEQAISTPDQLAQVPVEDTEGEAVLVDGQPLLLGDVAEIVEDHQPLIGDALCQEAQCLLLVIEKFPAANTPEVSEGVEAALAAMRPGLAGVTIDSAFYRPANYIDAAFGNFSMAFAIGVVLLALLLAVFTGWRSTLVSVVAIALSLAVAGLVLRTQEAPINLMVVAGLVLALGAVIGDAVLSISNTIRRLRQHGPEGAMPPRGAMVRESVLDMGSSAVFAGVLIVTAAIPAFFIPGQSGAFLPPVVTSYILALARSLLVALTVVPALSLMLLRGAGHDSSSAMKWLEARVASLASGALAKPSRATVLLVLIVLAGLVVVPFARGSLSPGLRERDVLIRQAAAPGTSLGQMNQITRQLVDELSARPGVGNVGAHVGRAITSDQLVNV
ncbi:MAG: efflux RND transporter permease subunit, partial [Actinomycetota bacterium]